jgi:protein involved in ribonucleotide reduction
MAIVASMMEAVSTSETSVSFFQTTRQNVPESHPNTHRRENLKSHPYVWLFMTYAVGKASLSIPKVVLRRLMT